MKDEASVQVESLMYKKKKKSPVSPAILIIVALLVLLAFKMCTPSKSASNGRESKNDAQIQTEATESSFRNTNGYLTDPSLIDKAVIEELAAYAIMLQTEDNNADNSGFTYSEVTYCGATFCRPFDNYSFSNYENSLDIFLTYEGSISNGAFYASHVYYTPMHFRNITVNEDGTVNVSPEDGVFASFFANDLDSAIEHLSDGGRYEVIRID